jgi:hypothetical protein
MRRAVYPSIRYLYRTQYVHNIPRTGLEFLTTLQAFPREKLIKVLVASSVSRPRIWRYACAMEMWEWEIAYPMVSSLMSLRRCLRKGIYCLVHPVSWQV